jgi:DNA-binding GntR family transcriptional regulator/anti-sigma regulatory factor (Ser/Thr protein kinase)
MNRTEQAYRYLMEEVLRGRWQAGDTLSTYALAEELKISRTPVMEALKRIEADGLVEIIPQVGCRIVRPSLSTVEELFALRGALEGLATEAAARRIGEEELRELEVLLHQLEAAAGRGDRAAYDDLNRRFHLRIVDASGMPRLGHSARGVWSPLRYQLARLPVTAEQLQRSIPEHREIYQALQRRAPKRARAAAERHAARSGARLVAQLAPGRDDRLVHRALIYAADEDFLAATVPFVVDGLDGGERVLAVTTRHNIALLEGAVGPRAGEIEFRDSDEWYRTPAHTLLAYERYVEHADRSRARVIGEPVWNGGQSAAAIGEWTRYESILNVALARAPVTFLCPYDTRALPGSIVADARRTHPELCTGPDSSPSPEFTEATALISELDRDPLEEPAAPTAEHPVTRDLRGVRRFVLEQAHRAGVSGKRLEDALLAVQEVAANAIVHGAGEGSVRTWVNDGELVFEVRDEGMGIADPLVAHLTPDPSVTAEPRGLWIARLLCDLVELRSPNGGLVVRLHIGLE